MPPQIYAFPILALPCILAAYIVNLLQHIQQNPYQYPIPNKILGFSLTNPPFLANIAIEFIPYKLTLRVQIRILSTRRHCPTAQCVHKGPPDGDPFILSERSVYFYTAHTFFDYKFLFCIFSLIPLSKIRAIPHKSARESDERICVRKRWKTAGILCVLQGFWAYFWRKESVRIRRHICAVSP